MAIEPAEVLRIAALARLEIGAAEADALAHDLQRIVEHIDTLAEVDLPAEAESLTYFDRDVHREDATGECLDRDAALRNAPETDGTFYLVPQIVDKEDA